MEDRYRAGEISNSEIAEQSAIHLSGYRISEVEELLADLPLLSGIDETLATLRTLQCRLLLCTITWSFASRYFSRRFRFDHYCGTRMEERNDCLTGRVSQHFNENDKLRFAKEQSNACNLAMSRCVAIGDSRSDVPLFQAAGLAIAVNATPDAIEAAHVAVQTDDARSLLPLIQAYLQSGES
jgi:phosphoserine phosphatase